MRGSRRASVLLAVALLGGTAACGDGTPASSGGHGLSPASAPSARPSPLPTATASDDNGRTTPSQTPLPRSTAAPPVARTFGADGSWPQCPKGMGIPQKRTEGRPMPTGAARFVVLGLTNGVSFVANPCLADQVRWVRERHLLAAAYSVVSYPDDRTLARLRKRGPFAGGTRLGGLRNVGYRAAQFNLDTLRRAGLETPVVWIDVEPVTGFPWSSDAVANAAFVQGVEQGYRDGGFRIGYYSLGSLWSQVVGTFRTGAPEWRPAGERGPAEAVRRCGSDWSFGGGHAVLAQWLEDGRDRDVTCPGAVPDLRRWFHRY